VFFFKFSFPRQKKNKEELTRDKIYQKISKNIKKYLSKEIQSNFHFYVDMVISIDSWFFFVIFSL